MENLYGVCFKLYHLTLIISFIIPFSSGFDRITVNNSISGNETIISDGGRFELGYFQPGKSSNWYIGIWYKTIEVKTVVWVANRVNPVLDKHNSEFKMLDGNLVLTDVGRKSGPIWSTNLNSTKRNSVQAVLLNSGNLVLREGGPNTNEMLWQSFDNLTDTWLPGGKIEYNKRTKKRQRLSSWKNVDDPSPGPYTLEINHEQQEYVIMWKETRRYWRSGSWEPEQQIFSLVPEMRLNFLYSFNFTDNVNETYFTFNLYDPKIISRFVMDSSGVIKVMTWLKDSQNWNQFWSEPKQQCQVYDYCGAFGSCTQNSLPFCSCLKGFEPKSNSDWGLSDYTSGCKRRTPLVCESSNSGKDKDRFFVYNGIVLPDNATSVKASSLQECELACLSNCSCNAYSYDNSNCSVWSVDLLNFQQLSEGDPAGKILYLKLAASEFPSKSKTKLIVGIAAGFIALILVILGLLLARRCRQKAQHSESKTPVEGSLIAFGYKEIQTATKNFSEKLGGGGFGSVFKGTLPDSSVIAVKKLESFSQGEKQFRTEVSTIGTVQHVNLVRLRGFCSEGAKKLLVYDHIENGSLDYHLFPDKNNTTLDWPKRYQIALGTARGLAYLHEKCRDCIIHCDIKPENILLDAEFCPRVADFGLAKLVGRDFSRVLTTMRGTRGYLAPEWISGLAITAKADVFSYGMVLFELLSGHRNIQQSGDGTIKFFPTWATSKISQDGDIMTILDPRLENNADATEVMKICKLACWCIQDDEYHRPSMGQVVQILEGVLDVNMPPIPKSLQVFNENDEEEVMFFTESSSGQSSQTRNTSSVVSSSS